MKFVFWSPQAGVIVYQYQIGMYDPKKVPNQPPAFVPVYNYNYNYSDQKDNKPVVDPKSVVVGVGAGLTLITILEYIGWGADSRDMKSLHELLKNFCNNHK